MVEVGDIVLRHQADGTQTPSIIVQVVDQDHVILYDFGVGGSGGTPDIIERGTQPGQWQTRRKEETI